MPFSRAIHLLAIGQSYAEEGFKYDAAYYACLEPIVRALRTNAAAVQTKIGGTVNNGDMIQVRNRAVGGSAIVQANDGGTGYWVANDLATAGPLLTATTAAIAGYSEATTNSGKPILTLYSQGEQEASMIANEAASQSAKTAIVNVLFPQIRSALNPGNPTTMPIWIDMLGPRFANSELREAWMRDRLIEICNAGTNVFRGAEKYAVQLDELIHPTPAGYAQLGAHAGRKMTEWLLGNTELRGPQVTSPTRSGNDVTVTITVPAGKTLVKPSAPDFFGLYDCSENRIPITGYEWSGNDLTIKGSSVPSKLRYPAPTGKKTVDITRIIRLSNPSSPIYTGEPGLVLESMLTATV